MTIPSVIFSNMHPQDFDAFTTVFNKIGWKVYIPSDREPNYFGYGATTVPTKGDYTMITHQEFLDIKPDVVLCLCLDQLKTSAKLAAQTGSKFVVRAGNNNVPYNKSHSDFLITNDTYTYKNCDIPNKLFLYLPLDYDFYCKQAWQRDSTLVTSYIHYYSKYWQNSYHKYDVIRRANTDIAFINFGVSGTDECTPSLTNPVDVRRMLGVSRCVLHVKEKEGYGWSILEAISCGIPVIAPKVYVVGKTCESFLVEDKSVIFIENTSDFRKAFDNVDQLCKLSEIGPKFIRELINLEEQSSNMKKFFEEVVLANA